jgi:hypothetical protein
MNSNNWQAPARHEPVRLGTVYQARWTSTNVTDSRIISAPFTTRPIKHLLFYNWSTPWEPGNGTSAATPAELHTEVDWVRVWE